MSNSTNWDYGNPTYALTRSFTGATFTEVVERTRAALQKEGFGVLTEIDVQGTLKKKLDVDVGEYLILGACNPSLAHRALQLQPGIGVLLPCNVVVTQQADSVAVSAVDPRKMFAVVDDAAVAPVAEEVRERLQRMLETL